MTHLQTLRNATRMAFLAMLWFALALVAAAVSPWLHANPGMVICSASGTHVQAVDSDGAPASQIGLHCPLCLSTLASAPPAFRPVGPFPMPGHAVPGFDAGVIATAVTVTPPPRAPPIFS